MCQGHHHDPRQIRSCWEELLGKKSRESEWQRFFQEFPCALAQSLPLAQVPISFKPLARPGKREPDFYFYEESPSPFPTYGIIDFKTADTRLISTQRHGFPVFSTAVQTGIQQLDYYAREVLPKLILVPKKSLLIGAGAHLILIAGLEEELAQKLGEEVFSSIGKQLPRGVQLLPFDTLLRNYEMANRRVTVMVPRVWVGEARWAVPPVGWAGPPYAADWFVNHNVPAVAIRVEDDEGRWLYSFAISPEDAAVLHERYLIFPSTERQDQFVPADAQLYVPTEKSSEYDIAGFTWAAELLSEKPYGVGALVVASSHEYPNRVILNKRLVYPLERPVRNAPKWEDVLAKEIGGFRKL